MRTTNPRDGSPDQGRRRFLQTAPAAGLAAALPASAFGGTSVGTEPANARDGAALYRALGVRPLINGRGTLTMLGGSIELPEVREAKALANQHHAHIEELMEAAGRRLADLTGAEWGWSVPGVPRR